MSDLVVPDATKQRAGVAVLLLEDSGPDAALVEARLQELGRPVELHRVDTRAAFAAALVGRRWDVILADYNVPSFDGSEAIGVAKQQAPETPLVFVSAAIGEDLAIDLFRQGATDYVLKDRMDRLVPSIERALRDANVRSERKRAQDALAENERMLQTLMGNMPGMAFRCRPEAPWSLEYASAGALDLTGFTAEELAADGGTRWWSLVHPDDRAALDAQLVPAANERQRTLRYRIKARSGEEKWVWDRAVGVYRASGVLSHLEGFITDITQQVEAELETQKRVDFEQQLIGIVSHDLRNPLNVILLASGVAVKNEGVPEPVTRSLLKIQSAGERAARMIGDLLDFTQARLGGGIQVNPKRTSLHELVEGVVDEAETTHPGRRIVVHHASESFGEWDPDRLAQALANLVVNALKHSPPTSVVTVRTQCVETGVEISVHNLGNPIPADLRGRLFKPMSRGTSQYDRTTRSVGLGLYIVDQIVRRHGGNVDVVSSADEGTTFTIFLPQVAVPSSVVSR